MSLFRAGAVVVAPTVAYMDVRRSLLRRQAAGSAEVRLVDITDTDAVLAACDGADVLWLESPTNPLLGIADLPRLCVATRERRMLCVVDNTFATPLLQRPLELGADLVVHSATKAMGGHSDLLLGAVMTPSGYSPTPPASEGSRRRSSAAPATPPSGTSFPRTCCGSASAANTSKTSGPTCSRRSPAPSPPANASKGRLRHVEDARSDDLAAGRTRPPAR